MADALFCARPPPPPPPPLPFALPNQPSNPPLFLPLKRLNRACPCPSTSTSDMAFYNSAEQLGPLVSELKRERFAQKMVSQDDADNQLLKFWPLEDSVLRVVNPQVENPSHKVRRLPIPVPHKLARPYALPRSKHILRARFPTWKPRVSPHMSHNDPRLEELAAALRDLPSATPASKILAVWECHLKRGSLSLVIKELGHMRLSFRVLQVILWLKKFPRLWPDDHSLCEAIKALVHAGEANSAIDLYSLFGSSSTSAAKTLALSLAKLDMFQQAIEILKSRNLANSSDAATVYVKLIVAAGSRGMHKAVKILLQELPWQDLQLKLEDCTALMALCSSLRMYDEVERFFSKYTQAGLQPNVVMYSVLMKAKSRAGKDREAMAIFWEMQKKEVVLDLVAYQVIMGVLGKLKDVSRAAKLFLEMKENNFSPTPDVYNTMLKLYCQDGRFGKAKRIMQEMQVIGYSVDSDLSTIVEQNVQRQ